MKNAGSIKIDVYDLVKGMYVEDIYDSNGNLIMTVNELILTNDQIKKIINRGVDSVYISREKGAVPIHLIPKEEKSNKDSSVFTIDDYQRTEHPEIVEAEAYYKELEFATKVNKRTISSIGGILKNLKTGRGFLIEEIRSTIEAIVNSLNRNSDAIVSTTQLNNDSEYLVRHSVNVLILTASTVKAMGYSETQVVEAAIGGLLHDIGMLRIPANIINKPGKLSDNEYNIIKQHPVFGLEYANTVKGMPDNSKKIILQHHEKYDGRGYPFGIKGSRIYEIAMVTSIADVYDALTSHRPYKRAVTPQKALAVLYKGMGREFDPSIVQLFTKNMGIFPVGSFVKLHCGIMGVVTHVDAKNILAPQILKLFNEKGEKLPKPELLDLRILQQGNGEDAYKIDISLEPDRFGIDTSEFIMFKI